MDRGESDADTQDAAHASVGEFKVKRTKERELERKRARGEVSCAECRRLKLKCNKKVPCSSCVRRGCHSICPNGALSTGQGSRFVLANTRKLHTKLLDMSQRIRQLEDALQIAQATISSQQHPLLSSDLLKIKAGVDEASGEPPEPQRMPNPEDDDDEEEEGVTAGIGTLSISERGEARFIGRVAAEALLINQPADAVICPMNSSKSQIEEQLPSEIVSAARGFPFMRADLSSNDHLALLEEYLPSYARATALAESYLENVNWLPRPVRREQIFEELIPAVYKKVGCEHADGSCDENIKAKALQKMHSIALAFALFACGAAADLTQEPQNSEGLLFSYVARAALNAHSVFDFGASLETIQALQLMSTYDFFSCSSPSLESSWKVMTFGMILATSIGLHRDPARWGLDEKQIQRRRSLFWELSSIDKFKCLGSGRPAMFHLKEIDCEFPEDTDRVVRPDGTIREGAYYWRIRFSKYVVGPIAETLSEMRPIKYSEIIEFDRKIREFDNPPFELSTDDKVDIYNVQGHMWQTYKDIALLFLHRNFFARAMIKHSDNPLRSPFAPSFLAAYACSIKLLRQVRKCFLHSPSMLLRMWPVWAHALTSGVIVGSVAARVKNPQLASAAFQDLNLCIQLFEEAKKHPVPSRGLPMLIRLRDRAVRTFAGDTLPKQLDSQIGLKQDEDDPDFELSILRGGAQYIQSGWSRSRGGKKTSRSRVGIIGHLLNDTDGQSVTTRPPRESGSESPQASTSSPSDAARGSETSSTGPSSQGDIVTPGLPLLPTPPTTTLMDPPSKPPVDVNEMDVNMLMNWLASDDITSSNIPPTLSPKMSSDPSLVGPNPQWNYNIATESPEGGQDMADISPAQGVAWLNQTFDSQAEPAAAMFNMSSFLGLPDPYAFQKQSGDGMPQYDGLPAGANVQASHHQRPGAAAAASSVFAPPIDVHQGMGPIDFSWNDILHAGRANGPGVATNGGARNGEDQSFMDAWRMQASVEGLDALPPSTPFSNLF